MNKTGYYPGCALEGSACDYDISVKKLANFFNIELTELDDWNCCGASSAHMTKEILASSLCARNLAIAEKQELAQVFAPCPLCSLYLNKANSEIKDNPKFKTEIEEIIENKVSGKTTVLNLIDFINAIGLEEIKNKKVKDLKDFNVACYYGCLLLRPPKITKFDHPEQPKSMEKIVEALGAKPIKWSFQTECCGSGFSLARLDSVTRLTRLILEDAKAKGANAVAVACPMCHSNLDMRQEAIEKKYNLKLDLPVFYLSELVGLALGIKPAELGIDKHFVKWEKDIGRAG